MSATITAEPTRGDYRILGMISIGHFVSHFYWLCLPPLFVQLREAFSVSYTELGVMMTVMAVSATIVQVPVGVLVDKIGAKVVLAAGLAVLAVSIGLMGLATEFWMVYVLAFIAGVGNSVFHPANYAILNSSITPTRMGRAFSIHTFAGHFGSAIAPAAMILLASYMGWRMALMAVGLIGLAVVLALLTQWSSMREDRAATAKNTETSGDTSNAPSTWALLTSKPVMLFFLFFTVLSMTGTGMQAFALAALVDLHSMPEATAATAISIYLFAVAGGTLIGGEITDRTPRHDIVAGIVFVITAVLTAMLALINLSLGLLAIVMIVMGIGQGIIRPARDMMLRAAMPKGTAGTLFGFVSAGILLGSALAPIPFGYALDSGRPDWVFYLIAIFMILCLFTVMIPKDIANTVKAGTKNTQSKPPPV